MIHISGDSNISVLLDSDAIIALVLSDDDLHSRALSVFDLLMQRQAVLFITATTVAETVVGLHRKFNERKKALIFLEKVVNRWATLVVVDNELLIHAHRILSSSQSKQNTIFDAINIAAIKKHSLDAIFSFDRWYTRHGVILLEDLER
jgi:predicted nucleic acid-binding protein